MVEKKVRYVPCVSIVHARTHASLYACLDTHASPRGAV